eukprot:6943243-Prorocentrum_lima.AAC.1
MIKQADELFQTGQGVFTSSEDALSSISSCSGVKPQPCQEEDSRHAYWKADTPLCKGTQRKQGPASTHGNGES